MNNIQKNFKAKRGLCMAQGGLIDQLDPSGQMSRMDLGALTNDPTVLNAAMDREGLAAEQARQAKYPGQTFMNPVAQPQRQAAPQQAAQLQPQQPLDKFREPAPTSFEQDNNARGLRIQGYGDQLAGMRKERLGLADGTANVAQAAQTETPEQVMARMAAKYGVSAQPTAAPVQAPQPVQQAPQPAPQRQGLIGGGMGLLKGRAAQIDKAVNGYAEGGIVRGKGGPTDDEVPMQVAGKDVNLSNSEAVLPVKTVHALGGPEAVEELIERTNGKPPVRGGLRAGGEYFTGTGGDVIDPKALRPEFRAVAQTPVIQPAANAGLEATRNIRAENAGSKYIDPRATASPQATPAPTQPIPRSEQFGRNAAKVYTDLGGARGMAGKAINALVPAAAALDTMGDAGIRVEGNREGDATNETAGGMTRVANAAKEVGLRAGDWGTKGADMLMDIPLWAANKSGATSDGKPLEYGLINKNYRQGMRDANLEGVTIPQSTGEQEMLNVKANAEADAFKKKHAAKDGSYGKADQGAIDALKAENAAKKADITLAAATKAGNFAGQNHIPEAVSPADRVVADSLGGVVDSATGVSRTGDGGLRGMAKRLDTYAKNDDVRGARNMREQLMGSGARFDKGSDGKITITNRGDFDGSTKMAYTGADGNPTAVHEGSQQHMQGLKDAQGLRNQLANFEQMNLKRNAQDDITDIGLRNSSRAALAAQGVQQAELTKARIAKEPSALDLEKHELEKQKFRHDLVKTNNLQGNNVRDFKAAQSAHMAKRTQTLLDNLVPTAGLKDDDLKLAQQDRADYEQALYAAHKRMPADDAEFDSNLPNVAAQAKLTMAHKKAMQGAGLWQKLSNAGVNPMITLTSMAPKIVGDNFVYENGYTLPTKLVLGNDPALLAAHRAREQTK